MNNKIYFSIKALSIIGIGLAVYLLWQQFARPAFQPCSINATINCDAVITGPLAKTFGVPTPLFGLIGYTVILLSAFWKKKKLMVATATFGLLFCLWIAYKELFELQIICPVCIACQTIMLTVFSLAITLVRRKDEHAAKK